MSAVERLSSAQLISELRREADDIQKAGLRTAALVMREAARRLENVETEGQRLAKLDGSEPTDSELLEHLRTHAPALIVRGLFASSGAIGVAFDAKAESTDTFEQRWDELGNAAREGWARLARLIAMCPQLFADTSNRIGVLQ